MTARRLLVACRIKRFHSICWLCAIALISSPCRGALTHYYPFSSDVSDAVGSADGALLGGASVSGGVLQLDGIDDFVQFGERIIPSSGSYTVAMFAKQTSPQLGIHVELISQQGGPNFYIGHDPSGIIRVSDAWTSTGVPFPSDGEFHHYAVTVDATAGNSRLYIDGSLSATLGVAINSIPGGTDTRLGRQFDGHAEYFGGAIDEVRIYDAALTAGQVFGLTVPEPATATLLMLGSGLFLAATRRPPV